MLSNVGSLWNSAVALRREHLPLEPRQVEILAAFGAVAPLERPVGLTITFLTKEVAMRWHKESRAVPLEKAARDWDDPIVCETKRHNTILLLYVSP